MKVLETKSLLLLMLNFDVVGWGLSASNDRVIAHGRVSSWMGKRELGGSRWVTGSGFS